MSVLSGRDHAKRLRQSLIVLIPFVAILMPMLSANTASAATTQVIEGEKMTVSSTIGGPYAAAGLNNGSALMIWNPGRATSTVALSGPATITVRANAQQCQGAPHMQVKVGTTNVMSIDVTATKWTTYRGSVNLTAGSYQLSITYTNDFKSVSCDRNLMIDYVSITAGAAASTSTGKWNTYKGFNYESWDGNATHAQQSMSAMVSTHANSVAFDVIWYQDSLTSSTMHRDATHTATDAELLASIKQAKALGIPNIMVRVFLTTPTSGWRGSFDPTDVDTWFVNYRAIVNYYASFSQANGVTMFDVGSEMNSLQTNSAQWRQIVADTRSRFKGAVTYSANWGSETKVDWWDAVDIMGIDAYYPLSKGATPSVPEVAARWSNFDNYNIVNEVTAAHTKWNKNVIFTEIGYQSVANNLVTPWSTVAPYSGAEQQRALDGAFQAWDSKPWFKGMFIWYWNAVPSSGGPGNTDHVVAGKPAEQTVRNRFGST